jgi:hypothetical protein
VTNPVEAAIATYASNPGEAALGALDLALVQGEFLIPVSAEVTAIEEGVYDVPAICIRTNRGEGAIPAFTTIGQLLKWKPESSKYTTLTGRSLFQMAIRMPEIAQIVVNVDGSPRGVIPRSEFERLSAQG